MSRLLRPIDTIFVDSLKAAMKANPSTDVAPIVGMVTLDEGEEFREEKKESYQYETLGGNNSRAALQVEDCVKSIHCTSNLGSKDNVWLSCIL